MQTHQLTPSLQLTTDHPASSHGIPVLVTNKNQTDLEGIPACLGPADMLEYGGNLWPAAKHVQRFAKHHPDNMELQEAAAAFCRQWPDGPQTELTSKLPAGARSHLDAPCPKCGGILISREAGSVPGEVCCEDCGWQGTWKGTENPWDMETGGAVARFEQ